MTSFGCASASFAATASKTLTLLKSHYDKRQKFAFLEQGFGSRLKRIQLLPMVG